MKVTSYLSMIALLPSALTLTGCGLGKKMVSDLDFASETVGGIHYAGFDAKVSLGGGELPYGRLPVVDPRNSSRELGYIDVGGRKISLRIDVEGAAQVPVMDGRHLPNGRPIPVTLPSDVTPIMLPVAGSNTKVYLALGRKNMMAGIALTLKPTDERGGIVGDLLRFPSNIFFPFSLSSEVKGSAGIFTGTHFGLGVFAVKSDEISAGISVSSRDGDRMGSLDFSRPEKFGVKTQSTDPARLMKVNNGLRSIDALKLD